MNIGKVFLVPFPWDDFSSLKVRPTLCLSEPVGEHRQMVVAYIGSKIPEELLESDIVLKIDEPGLAASGLHKTSVIRVHRLMTVTAESVQREIGRLPISHLTEVKGKLKDLFRLDSNSSGNGRR